MKLTVLNVDSTWLGSQNEIAVWRVKYSVEYSEGEVGQPIFYHHFPKSQIDYTSAAYGVDDMSEIVDMILAEPFLDEDPAASLFSKGTEEARVAHVTRCARAKLRSRLSSRGVQNPLEMIRNQGVNPEARKRHMQELNMTRREFRGALNG